MSVRVGVPLEPVDHRRCKASHTQSGGQCRCSLRSMAPGPCCRVKLTGRGPHATECERLMTCRSKSNATMLVASLVMLTVTGCHSTPGVVSHPMSAQSIVASDEYAPPSGYVSSGYAPSGSGSTYSRYQAVSSAMPYPQTMPAPSPYTQRPAQSAYSQPTPSFVTTSPYSGYGTRNYGTQSLPQSRPSSYSGSSWAPRPSIRQVHCSPGGT